MNHTKPLELNKSDPEYNLICWYKGFFRDKMRPHKQTELYDEIKKWKRAHPQDIGPIVVNAHRRIGKTRMSIWLALERALRKPDQEIRFVAPTEDMCEEIVIPQLEECLRDCPEDLFPKKRGNQWMFRNPAWETNGVSRLWISGSEYKKGNRERGKGSHFVILDEFRDMEDPERLIDEIIAFHFVNHEFPLLLIISTPPSTMDHPMVRRFIPEAQKNSCYFCIKATENMDFTIQDQKAVLKVCHGDVGGIPWRREALCELIPDPRGLIIPEFVEIENSGCIDQIVVDYYPTPDYYFPQVCIDTGYDDYNGIIYYYVDFLNQTIVICDELWMNRSSTENLIEKIQDKSAEVFGKAPYQIVYYGDLTRQARADWNETYKIPITPVDKKDRDINIMRLRDTIRQKRIRIVKEKCPFLLFQLRNGQYSSSGKDFIRKPDDEEIGHCDLLAALIYGHRHANWYENPYPAQKRVFGHNFIQPEEDEKDKNFFEIIDVEEVRI